jgi:antitoxin ParD1/3/4
MPIRNVVLSEQDEALIANLVETGKFRDASDVMQEGLRMVEASRKQEAVKEEEMRNAIRAGLDDLDQGRFVTLSEKNETASHIRSLAQRAATGQAASGH